MLSLTKKTEYALIALSHLARAGNRVVSAREIADAYGVKLPLLMNVLKVLHQRGFLRSVRGMKGGYTMTHKPGQVSLAQVVAAIEGPARLVKCVSTASGSESCCELLGSCPVRRPVMKLHAVLEAFLTRYTIADVAFDDMFGATADMTTEHNALRVLAR